MAAPITPIEPRPFVSQTVTLPDDNTVVELDPQPFSNTKELILLNTSDTDGVLVQVAVLGAIPAAALLKFDQIVAGLLSGPPIAGDTITIDGLPLLTGVIGPQISGANNFSAPSLATAVINVLFYPVPAGLTITCLRSNGTLTTLTGVIGAPGLNQFQVDAGNAALVAASINAAINADPALNMGRSSVVGTTVTLWGITPTGKVGTLDVFGDPWESRALTSSLPLIIAISATFTPGTDAEVFPDSPILIDTNQYPSQVKNVAWNIYKALTDPLNAYPAVVIPQLALTFSNLGSGVDSSITLVATVPGAAGNLIAVSASTPFPPPPVAPKRAVFTTATLVGGSDAIPTAADVTLGNSTFIPPGSAITLSIGSEGNRQPLAGSAWWAVNPGSKYGIVLRASTGVDVFVNVTFVQNRGYPEGV